MENNNKLKLRIQIPIESFGLVEITDEVDTKNYDQVVEYAKKLILKHRVPGTDGKFGSGNNKTFKKLHL